MNDALKQLEALEGLIALPLHTDLTIEAGVLLDSTETGVAWVDVFQDFGWTDEQAHAVASVIAVAVNEWVERTRAGANIKTGEIVPLAHIPEGASNEPDAHCEISQGSGDTASSLQPEWRAQLIRHIDAISALPVWPRKYPSERQLAAFVAGLQAGERSGARDGLANEIPSQGRDAATLDLAASRAFCSAVRQATQTQRAALNDRGHN